MTHSVDFQSFTERRVCSSLQTYLQGVALAICGPNFSLRAHRRATGPPLLPLRETLLSDTYNSKQEG